MARLLLLNYHPDLSKGGNHVLALMFDMNLLWEKFVLVSLRKGFKTNDKSIRVRGQVSKYFWEPKEGARTSIRPDIVIDINASESVILDTKWKNLGGVNPSPDDLRQMYVYHQYYKAQKVAIIYPGTDKIREGRYVEVDGTSGEIVCSLVELSPENDLLEWQKTIFRYVYDWIYQ